MPQSEFLYDEDGNCLVDFVGRFESLQQDFDTVSRRIFGEPVTLPHRNESSRAGIRNFIARTLKSEKRAKKPHYSQL